MKKSVSFSLFWFALVMIFVASAHAQTSVAGEWDGSLNTPGGPRPLKFVFTVDGEKLSGTAKRSSGDVPLKGTVKGSDISFSYTISYNGNDLTLSFSGKVSGDDMSGTVSFAGQAEDSWSAKRTATTKPKN